MIFMYFLVKFLFVRTWFVYVKTVHKNTNKKYMNLIENVKLKNIAHILLSFMDKNCICLFF